MNFDWSFFLTALGLALILEGLPYFLFAEKMPKVLATLAQRRPSSLRVMGLVAMGVGLAVIFLLRGD